jgi:glycosyltransferase involved in cell wall biosynthesis
MQHTSETGHAPGTVIIPAASLARYAEFWISVESLVVPYGTKLISVRGADIPYQLNESIRNMSGEWIFILGDDHTFDPDLLLKLLDRQADVVIPIVPRRDPPFVPVLMHGPIAPHMARYNWSELPISGTFQLPKWDSAGQAGAVIRKSVLDKLGDPWFEGGKLTPGRLMEDMYFIQRLHELDIPITIDCDQVMTHIANITVKPFRHEGRWYAGYHGPTGPVLWDEPDYNYLPAGVKFA